MITLNNDAIIKRIIAIIERGNPLPSDTLTEKLAYRYLDEGHIDSFAILNLIVELEDEFYITLSPEDTQSDEFRTAGGLVSIIKGKVAK